MKLNAASEPQGVFQGVSKKGFSERITHQKVTFTVKLHLLSLNSPYKYGILAFPGIFPVFPRYDPWLGYLAGPTARFIVRRGAKFLLRLLPRPAP